MVTFDQWSNVTTFFVASPHPSAILANNYFHKIRSIEDVCQDRGAWHETCSDNIQWDNKGLKSGSIPARAPETLK